MPASSSRKSAKYPLTALSIFHEAMMQMNDRNAVSNTIGTLRPSTPMKYSMLKLLIQV